MSPRRPAIAAGLALTALGAYVTPASAATSYPKASKYATGFQIAQSVNSSTSVAVDAGGTAHAVFRSSSSSITSCTVPRGKRSCSATVQLLPLHAGAVLDNKPVVVLPAPGVVDVISSENGAPAPDNQPTLRWVSHDNGASFGAPVEVVATGATIAPTASAVVDGSNIVALDEEGGRETVFPADGAATVTPGVLLEPDELEGGTDVSEIDSTAQPGIVALGDGSLITAHTRINQGGSPDTTIVQTQTAPGGAPTTVATLQGENIRSLVTGTGGTFLMTRSTDSQNSNSDTVRVRKITGGVLSGALVVPRGESYDSDAYRLAEDKKGDLHAFWIGGIYDRAFTAISTNGGKSWTTHALSGLNLTGTSEIALAPEGYGVALTAGAHIAAYIQPLLIYPTVSLSLKHSSVTVKGKAEFSGKVSPAVPGAKVTLQQIIGKHAPSYGSAREGKDGSFSLTLTQHTVGKRTYDAFVDGTFGIYDTATSRTVRVTTVEPKK